MKKSLPVLLCFLLFAIGTQAQPKKRKASMYNASNKANPFLQQQWWIGLKGGANFSQVKVEKSYSIISPTNYNASVAGKKYEKNEIGTQIGLEATYVYRGFSASLQPTYQTTRFTYGNSFVWTDTEDPSKQLMLDYTQKHEMAHILLPFVLKYEMHFNSVSPYIQAGAYLARLVNANKEVSMSGVDYASGGTNQLDYSPVMVGATDLFAKNHYGFMAGAGLYYNMGNIRLNLDIQYRLSQSVINSAENRYQNDRLAGIGDAMDDLTMNNVAISFGTLFPLRFLSSGFKSYDK